MCPRGVRSLQLSPPRLIVLVVGAVLGLVANKSLCPPHITNIPNPASNLSSQPICRPASDMLTRKQWIWPHNSARRAAVVFVVLFVVVAVAPGCRAGLSCRVVVPGLSFPGCRPPPHHSHPPEKTRPHRLCPTGRSTSASGCHFSWRSRSALAGAGCVRCPQFTSLFVA